MVVLLGADSHEEIARTLEAAGVKVPLLVDEQDIQDDFTIRSDLN